MAGAARRAADANFAGLLGRMAAYSGTYVTWDQALKSNFQYVADIDHLTFDTPAPIKAGPDGICPAPLPGMTNEC